MLFVNDIAGIVHQTGINDNIIKSSFLPWIGQ